MKCEFQLRKRTLWWSSLAVLLAVAGVETATCRADDETIASLMPVQFYLTDLMARRPDSEAQLGDGPKATMISFFTYQAREIAGVLYFQAKYTSGHPDPSKLAAVDKVAHPIVDLFHTANGLIVGCRNQKGKEPSSKVQYWAIDWKVDPPEVVYVDQPKGAAVWTWESRKREVDSEGIPHQRYSFPKGTFLITHDDKGRAYYLGLGRETVYRTATKHRILEFRRPVLTTEQLWVFQHNMLFADLPDRRPLDATRQPDPSAADGKNRRDPNVWKPDDMYAQKYVGLLVTPDDQYTLETMDGQAVFRSRGFQRIPPGDPAAGKAINSYKRLDLPDVRLLRTPTDGSFRIGWDYRLGVGFRFFAVDWSSDPPQVVVTREPSEAAIWRLVGGAITRDENGRRFHESAYDSYHHVGAFATKNKAGQDYSLALEAKEVAEPVAAGWFEMLRKPILLPKSNGPLVYKALIPKPVDGL